MIITNDMIKEKEVVGKTCDGEPVVMVVTNGGLFAFFAKTENGVETLGMAPHRAIAAWMVEKKSPGVKWKDNFLKSEDDFGEELIKSEKDMFIKLRSAIFSPKTNTLEKKEQFEEMKDYYLFYDTESLDIGIMHKQEIDEFYSQGKFSGRCLVRSVMLNEPVSMISYHKEFGFGKK